MSVRLALCLLLGFLAQASYGQNPPAGFSSTTIASGWTQPVGIRFSDDGKMFVWERAGLVWMLEKNASGTYVKPATPLLDLSQEVGNWRDHGLLGLALDPAFSSNGRIYLLYVVDRYYLNYHGANNQALAGYNPVSTNLDKWGASYQSTFGKPFGGSIGRLTRYTARASDGFRSIDPSSRKVLLGETISTGVAILYETHGIGSLAFGTDGSLLVSTGDGSSTAVDTGNYPNSYASQAQKDGLLAANENIGSFRAQYINTHSGKILRLDPSTGNGLPSNPYYDAAQPRAPRSRVFALGFRNPCRFTVRPGTGSTDISIGDPGVLYVGDVGLDTWEELDVVTGKGQNFGWPIYEGMTWNASFGSNTKANPDAVNPLYNNGSCTQATFSFVSLLKEDAQSGPSFPNPCNSSQQIPAKVPHWVHTRPVLDWKHDSGPARSPGFDAQGKARPDTLGKAGALVSGSSFAGGASLAGVWYTASNFPAQYKNTYFHGDYVNRWIRNMKFNTSNQPISVDAFIPSGAVPVSMAVNNQANDGALYYVEYRNQEVRRVAYTGNKPPVVVVSSNKTYGPSSLAVQFSSSGTLDPDGPSVTYSWNFGDGTTSTQANPSHTFTGSGSKKFTVILTATDSKGAKSTGQLIISINNTPPVVHITSPVNNTKYSVATNTDVTYQLRASVTDAEQSGSGLTYAWQTVLHHNTHVHEEPVDNSVSTSTDISPLGCDGQQYFFSITLTVTDAAGLSGSDVVNLYPDCNATTSNVLNSFTLINADTDKDIQTLINGATLNLATLPTKNLNIRANTSPATVGSVVFNLSGQYNRNFTEGKAPYSLFGDASGNYNAWMPSVGSYTLKGTPYSANGGTGVVGSALTVGFKVINQAARTLASEESSEAVGDLRLSAQPNPFSQQLSLTFSSPEEATGVLTMYDVRGFAVRALFHGRLSAGEEKRIEVAAGSLPEGMYVLRLVSGKRSTYQKVVLVR